MFATSLIVKGNSSSINDIRIVALRWNRIVSNSKIMVTTTDVKAGWFSTKVTVRIDVTATNARNGACALLQVSRLVA